MDDRIAHGTSLTHGETHVLRFVLELPHPVTEVWPRVASPAGLQEWLCAADVFEPHIGGQVRLRWLNTDEGGNATVAAGEVTAWDVERVAEYEVILHGRIRFHLEAPSPDATILRFTNEIVGPAARRLDSLAGWHNHFEFLADALDGRPKNWSTWTLDRWRELRADYERRGGRQV
ncbi:hypothetical protein [Streptomyces spiramyceticus]|uniref:hypothetical protein n=1 Tax=Streptomyces spiramyceticus TaxID=299717 RepID=UPI00237A14E2|nr:hypothetical protein [Streptomyces spiramyceticus]